MATVRLAELLGVLSRATDLAMGQPFDSARTSCLLAVRLAEAAGFSEGELRDVYDYAHLRYIGCNAETDLLASLFGDELELRRDFFLVDQASQSEVVSAVVRAARRATAGQGTVATIKAISRALTGGAAARTSFLGHCEVGRRLANLLGFSEGVIEALGQLYGRWDGKGVPSVTGDEVSPVTMCVTLAQDALNYLRLDGESAAAAVVARRGGMAYRPDLAEVFARHSSTLLAGLDEAPSWQALVDLEPGPPRWLDTRALAEAFGVIADFVDIKSPWTLGHSPAVAALAAGPARLAGLSATDVSLVGHAGLVHDLGTVGVSGGTWGHVGAFSEAQWEQVRLLPYQGDRVLARCAPLAAAGALAVFHHERMDGAGYHRGLAGSAIPAGARILAAADVYSA
jgi:hypothetical protein